MRLRRGRLGVWFRCWEEFVWNAVELVWSEIVGNVNGYGARRGDERYP